MNGKRLYKSRDKKVCGVCGGIAEYFDIDPTIVRIIYVVLIMFAGVGILPYIIAAIIMDDAPSDYADRISSEKSSSQDTSYSDSENTQNSYSAQNEYESDEPVGFNPIPDDDEIKGFNP